jgi:conjugative transfer signal peptidase TraF
MKRFERKTLVRVCRLALLTGTLPAAITVGGLLGFRFNLTPSEPLGLWRIKPLGRPAGVGDLVFVCPPQTDVMRQALERGYLRSGLCPSGYAPLIKTVVAIGGQRVEVRGAVSIDGTLLANSDTMKLDGEGRSLQSFAGGLIPSGDVFLCSNFRGSFDSRYFGPVPGTAVLGFAQEVLTNAP